MKHNYDYPVVGSVEVTALDLAFINKMFSITTELGKHPYVLDGQFRMTTDVAFIITLDKHCEKFVTSLHDIHEKNLESCVTVQQDFAPEVAHIVLAILCAAAETSKNPKIRDEFDAQVEKLFNSDHAPEPTGPTKAGGFPNAPETGYQ